MSSQQVARLPKPVMRGHLKAYMIKHLAIAGVLSIGAAFAWKYLVAEPRKRRYAEFYRTYDAQADFERMDALGLFCYFEENDADKVHEKANRIHELGIFRPKPKSG